jgi:putative flippase GtrA
MASLVADTYGRIRHLIPELAKFGVVGAIGAIIDLGGAGVLYGVTDLGPLKAKAISVCVATAFTYLGSRYWTFRHRQNQPLRREVPLFIVLNVIGLLIAEAVIALTTYGLGLENHVAYNLASFVGTGLGTIFRYFSYKRWVFLKPVPPPAEPVEPFESSQPSRLRGAGGYAGPVVLRGAGSSPAGRLRGRNTAKTGGLRRARTTRPPSAAAMVRASDSPRPVPSGRSLTPRSKIRDTSSAGMPSPSSSTSITTERAACERRIVTVPLPCMRALSSSVAITCARPPSVT